MIIPSIKSVRMRSRIRSASAATTTSSSSSSMFIALDKYTHTHTCWFLKESVAKLNDVCHKSWAWAVILNYLKILQQKYWTTAEACEYVNDKYASEATMEPIDWLSLCCVSMCDVDLHCTIWCSLRSFPSLFAVYRLTYKFHHELNDKAEISVICVSHCRWSTDELCTDTKEENKNYMSEKNEDGEWKKRQ